MRFAKNVWNINDKNKDDEIVALEGINALKEFIEKTGMVATLKELGTTKDMLPMIANSSDTGGHYKYIDSKEILEILEECYE